LNWSPLRPTARQAPLLLLLLLLRRRRRLSPVVHRGMNCLHQAPRNVGAFVRCGPAYRKQRRAFALFHPFSSAHNHCYLDFSPLSDTGVAQ